MCERSSQEMSPLKAEKRGKRNSENRFSEKTKMGRKSLGGGRGGLHREKKPRNSEVGALEKSEGGSQHKKGIHFDGGSQVPVVEFRCSSSRKC